MDFELGNFLIFASSHSLINCVKELIEYGADVNYEDEVENISPLICACRSGSVECAKFLIDAGAEIEFTDSCENSALSFSCMESYWKGFYECAKLLINSGANINIQNECNYTPLILACQSKNYKCAKLLIDSGADVNIKDADDYTAFVYACQNEDFKCAKILMDAGADGNIEDISGNSMLPVYLTLRSENLKIITKESWDIIRKHVRKSIIAFYWYRIVLKKHYAPGSKYYYDSIEEFNNLKLN